MHHRGFWDTITYPAFGLSPMDGVTDAAFRYMVAKYSHPSVILTEFTSVEGIRAGATRLLDDFEYSELERPVAAQLFGADPSAFFVGAVAAAALGFDGIDINMGCPAKNVTERGAGASLIRDPERAKEIIRQTRLGLAAWADGMTLAEAGVPEEIIRLIVGKGRAVERRPLPVSVKTRVGYDEITIAEWVRHLLEMNPANISVHGRTLKQAYTGLADWDAIGLAASIAHEQNEGVTVLGNGDIKTMPEAREKTAVYGTDGVLVGRGTFGNPWFFSEHEASFEERMAAALEHARYLHTIFPGKGFIRIRKHLLDYCRGTDGAKELRTRLMRVDSLEQVEEILAPYDYK